MNKNAMVVVMKRILVDNSNYQDVPTVLVQLRKEFV